MLAQCTTMLISLVTSCWIKRSFGMCDAQGHLALLVNSRRWIVFTLNWDLGHRWQRIDEAGPFIFYIVISVALLGWLPYSILYRHSITILKMFIWRFQMPWVSSKASIENGEIISDVFLSQLQYCFHTQTGVPGNHDIGSRGWLNGC